MLIGPRIIFPVWIFQDRPDRGVKYVLEKVENSCSKKVLKRYRSYKYYNLKNAISFNIGPINVITVELDRSQDHSTCRTFFQPILHPLN